MQKDEMIYKRVAIDVVNQWLYDSTDKRILSEVIKSVPSIQPIMQGWVCPVCGKGVSPFVSVCPCKSGKGWEITC